VVIWEVSDLPWDGDVPYDGPLFDALCLVGGEVVASLGCIDVETLDDPYCREIERELIEEAASQQPTNAASRLVDGITTCECGSTSFRFEESYLVERAQLHNAEQQLTFHGDFVVCVGCSRIVSVPEGVEVDFA